MNTNCSDVIKRLEHFRNSVVLGQYDLTAPFPHSADNIVDGIADSVCELNPVEAQALRGSINRELAEKLLAYSRRAAVRALREHSKQRLLDGMVAAGIDDDHLDIRDVFRAWVLHYDACQRIQQPFEVLFERATQHSTEARKRQLANQFLRGPAYTKSIKTMKFAFVEEEGQPIYVDQLFGWP